MIRFMVGYALGALTIALPFLYALLFRVAI